MSALTEQIGSVAVDNRTRANHRFKFRAIGASSSGLCSSFAARTVGDWNQLPAVAVEQENPAAFKNQYAVTHHHRQWRNFMSGAQRQDVVESPP